uniref:Secreted protein n=1 Tax=Anguilla anguilla TaxID=7936 RepID=A0A0E9UGN9_ANGAN
MHFYCHWIEAKLVSWFAMAASVHASFCALSCFSGYVSTTSGSLCKKCVCLNMFSLNWSVVMTTLCL